MVTALQPCQVRCTRPCFIQGKARRPGDVVPLDPVAAVDAVRGGRCEYATADDRARAIAAEVAKAAMLDVATRARSFVRQGLNRG